MRIATLLCTLFLPFAAHAASDPAAALARLAPGEWLEYRVDANDPRNVPCCFDWDGRRAGSRGCRLKDGTRNFGTTTDDPPPAPGEGLHVLLRRGPETFDRVVAVGTSCPVDAQGERVLALDAVDPGASVRLLAHGAAAKGGDRRGMAMHAIANHAGEEATTVLANIAQRGPTREARRDAYFWLAEERGQRGYEVVRDALRTEPQGELRRHLVFCLSESRAPGAAAELMEMARSHADEDTRGEALFWLAQTNDDAVLPVFDELLAPNDDSR
jgi:hypothetical protein